MTVSSRLINTFLSWTPDAVDVPLKKGLRVQILPSLIDLPRARKHQFAAFIAEEGIMVVWDDDSTHIIERAKSIEKELMDLIWATGNDDESVDDIVNEKDKSHIVIRESEVDEELGLPPPQERATHLLNTILVACTLVIVLMLLGLGFRSVANELLIDLNYMRLVFVLLTPIQVFFTLVYI